jgi:hypothetical protein
MMQKYGCNNAYTTGNRRIRGFSRRMMVLFAINSQIPVQFENLFFQKIGATPLRCRFGACFLQRNQGYAPQILHMIGL